MAENSADALLKDLLDHETAVWTALKNGDTAADMSLLHPDFFGVYADGFATREDHAAQLDHGASIRSFELSNIRVMRLGPKHALLSYRADFVRQKTDDSETMYVSSVWSRTDSGWVNVFSQDTAAIE